MEFEVFLEQNVSITYDVKNIKGIRPVVIYGYTKVRDLIELQSYCERYGNKRLSKLFAKLLINMRFEEDISLKGTVDVSKETKRMQTMEIDVKQDGNKKESHSLYKVKDLSSKTE